jgi:hypothetical protein
MYYMTIHLDASFFILLKCYSQTCSALARVLFVARPSAMLAESLVE